MSVRVVITSQQPDGKSKFVSDKAIEPVVPPLLGGNEIWQFWGEDETPSVPHDGTTDNFSGFFPGAKGYRFSMFTIPSEAEIQPAPEDFDAALAETERLTPGITSAVTDGSGMHTTATIDFLYIVEGEVWLELDSGDSKPFEAGDVIIQAGANHAWYNRHPTQRAKVLLVFVGAESD
jgi:uncharacterized cupin superfamily protein